MLFGVTVRVPGAIPVPEKVSSKGEFEALLTIATLPAKLPELTGANFALKVALFPGPRFRGRLSPVMLNPTPVTFACVTVTLLPPEFVNVTDCVWLLPV